MLIIVIGLSPSLASEKLRKEIYGELKEFFEVFDQSVSSMQKQS
jgi:hypothetical protein